MISSAHGEGDNFNTSKVRLEEGWTQFCFQTLILFQYLKGAIGGLPLLKTAKEHV